MAPSRTASAFLAASRASSVKGDPVASIDAYPQFIVSKQTSILTLYSCIGTHTTKQVVLKVDAEVITTLLNDTQDLIQKVQSVLRSFSKPVSHRKMLLTLRASAVTYDSEVSIS